MVFAGLKLPSELSSGGDVHLGGTASGEDLSSPRGLSGANYKPVDSSGRYVVVNAVLGLLIRLQHQGLLFPLASKLALTLSITNLGRCSVLQPPLLPMMIPRIVQDKA